MRQNQGHERSLREGLVPTDRLIISWIARALAHHIISYVNSWKCECYEAIGLRPELRTQKSSYRIRHGTVT